MNIVGVVEAKIQTVEGIYGLLWDALANRRPIEASYHGLPRLFCPRRLGRNKANCVYIVLSVRRRKRKRT